MCVHVQSLSHSTDTDSERAVDHYARTYRQWRHTVIWMLLAKRVS